MLISHKNQFIFIHILKTAGTAVSEGFAPYSRLVDRLIYGYPLSVKFFNATNILMKRKGTEWLTGFPKHARAMGIKEKLPEPVWKNYFKFAFVRNPWDWEVSLYTYIREAKKHRWHERLQKMSFPDFVELVEAGGNRLAGADATIILNAVNTALASRPDFSVDLYGVGQAAGRIAERMLHLLPQTQADECG